MKARAPSAPLSCPLAAIPAPAARRQTLLAGAALALAAACLPWQAQAQTAWPTKPVRIVVGFSAGGPTDLVARAFAEHASRALGQPVVIDNKPGANGMPAADAVARAKPDGHTLLLAASSHAMLPALHAPRLTFDPVRGFAPVCTLADSPTALVVGPAMKAATLGDFVQQVRAAPGKHTYATPGTGHFPSEEFLHLTGLRMQNIPYKGAAQVVADLMGGQVDASFATLGSVLAQVRSGKLAALAVADARRSPLLPQVPTFEEAGVKGYRNSAWYGLLAPAGTPPAALAALEKAAQSFAQAAATHERLNQLGMHVNSVCGQAFGQQLAQEVQGYLQLGKTLGIKAE